MSLSPGNVVKLGRVFGGSQSLDDVVRDMRLVAGACSSASRILSDGLLRHARVGDARGALPYNSLSTIQGLSTMSDVQQRIDDLVKNHRVVLFMKGTAQFPMCGFSGRAIQILKACGVDDLKTVNVLEDDEIRQGIK